MGLLQHVLDRRRRRGGRCAGCGAVLRHPSAHPRCSGVRRWSRADDHRAGHAVAGQLAHRPPQPRPVRAAAADRRQGHGEPNPTWIPAGNEAVRRLAERDRRLARRQPVGEVFNIPMTAHFLGGCADRRLARDAASSTPTTGSTATRGCTSSTARRSRQPRRQPVADHHRAGRAGDVAVAQQRRARPAPAARRRLPAGRPGAAGQPAVPAGAPAALGHRRTAAATTTKSTWTRRASRGAGHRRAPTRLLRHDHAAAGSRRRLRCAVRAADRPPGARGARLLRDRAALDAGRGHAGQATRPRSSCPAALQRLRAGARRRSTRRCSRPACRSSASATASRRWRRRWAARCAHTGAREFGGTAADAGRARRRAAARAAATHSRCG